MPMEGNEDAAASWRERLRGGWELLRSRRYDPDRRRDGLLSGATPQRFVDDEINGKGVFRLIGGVLAGSDISTARVELGAVRVNGNVTISSAFVDFTSLAINNGSVVSLTGESAQVGFDIEIRGGGTLIISGDESVYTGSSPLALVGAITFEHHVSL